MVGGVFVALEEAHWTPTEADFLGIISWQNAPWILEFPRGDGLAFGVK